MAATLLLLLVLVVAIVGAQSFTNLLPHNKKNGMQSTQRCLALSSHGHQQPSKLQVFHRPCLAVITEPDACDSNVRVQETLATLEQVICNASANTSTNTRSAISLDQANAAADAASAIDLIISVRISKSNNNDDDDNDNVDEANSINKSKRVQQLIQALVDMVQSNSSNASTVIVVSSDWIDEALQAGAHGIHVKESHLSKIPAIRQRHHQQQLEQQSAANNQNNNQSIRRSFWIGTSAHSIDSALRAYQHHKPDYFFVGTCYPTASHPEKRSDELEGPQLPGQVQQALMDAAMQQQQQQQQQGNNSSNVPPVLAIGGIDASNCQEPIEFGAHGVATIRAVLQAANPVQVVQDMRQSMKVAFHNAVFTTKTRF